MVIRAQIQNHNPCFLKLLVLQVDNMGEVKEEGGRIFVPELSAEVGIRKLVSMSISKIILLLLFLQD